MANKVLFTKSVSLLPVRKGIYKDPIKDCAGFRLLVEKADGVEKGCGVHRRRKYGEDTEFDEIMSNIGQTAGADGEYAEQQLVFGWANVTMQEDGTTPFDWQGDKIATETLECAAYNYVMQHGMANEVHEQNTSCGFLVESMMFTKDKMLAMGIPEGTVPEGWFVGFYIPDHAVYEKVKNGEYNMFSIEGCAERVPLIDGLGL